MKATVLQFPKRNKGRVRKSESLFAMGETALTFNATAPVPAPKPANVEVLHDHRVISHDRGELAFMLAASIFAMLPPDDKDKMKDALRSIGTRDLRAREIVRLLGA